MNLMMLGIVFVNFILNLIIVDFPKIYLLYTTILANYITLSYKSSGLFTPTNLLTF